MTDRGTSRIIHGYIATKPLELFGKYTYAYGLLVLTPTIESSHWGVKNNEHQWVDMEMFALRRLLRAMTLQDPDQVYKANIICQGAFLSQRLDMAAKTKRDIDRGEVRQLWNHEAWIETSTLWDMYRGGMREADTPEERSNLNQASEIIKKEYWKTPSPLKTSEKLFESTEDLVLSL